MNASIAIQILPNAENNTELCRIVDEVIAYIHSTGLTCQVGAFETTIDGENSDELLDIAKECMKIATRAGATKVSAYIKVVCGEDVLTIAEKTAKYRQEEPL